MYLDILAHAFESVLTLAVIGVMGFFAAQKGWIKPDSNVMFSRLITIISLPCFMVYSIPQTFTHDELTLLAPGTLVPFLAITTTFLLALAFAKIFKVDPKRRGLFCVAVSNSNTLFIGVPVNIALFGEASLPYALLYFLPSTAFFWTVCNYALASDNHEVKVEIFSTATIQKIFSPPLLGFFVGLFLVWFDLKLPVFLQNAAKHVGLLATPLILLTLGAAVKGLKLNRESLSRDLVAVMLGRFILCPAILMLYMWFIPVPELMRKVFIIQSSLPIVANLAILSAYYDTDKEFGALAVSISTLLSVITIPIFMLIAAHQF